MTPHVFISYSRQDQAFALKLKEDLEAQALEVWIDQSELIPGQTWRAGIVAAIEACGAFLLILSPASVRSVNVVKELAIAEENGKKIIPVLHTTCSLTPEMKYSLAGMQYQDFSRGQYENNLAKLMQVLQGPTTGEKSTPTMDHMTKVVGSLAKTLSLGRLDFVLVPKGPFVMGSIENDELAYEFEKPQHTLEIEQDYWLSRAPITNAQFERFIQSNPGYQTTAEKGGFGWVFISGEWKEIEGACWRRPRGPQSSIAARQDHPVVQVSYYDAMDYCAWFNIAHRNELGELDLRLPSEAEWEKGARGPYGYRWPWGEVWDARRCNSSEEGVGDTTPVGHYSLLGGDSPYGVADMAGNVYEWTGSLWGVEEYKAAYGYPYNPGDGREKTDAGADIQRVLRGGSFLNDRKHTRCAFRGADFPWRVAIRIGFRVAACPNRFP